MKPIRLKMKHSILLAMTLFASVSFARLPSTSEMNSEDTLVSLDNSLEYYYGNRESTEALQQVRRHIQRVQAQGIATRLQPITLLDDASLKNALDKQVTEVAFVSDKVRECSYAMLTVLALTQGKCVKRPEPIPRPQIVITTTGGVQ